jgi:hypothetical protein
MYSDEQQLWWFVVRARLRLARMQVNPKRPRRRYTKSCRRPSPYLLLLHYPTPICHRRAAVPGLQSPPT